MSDWTIEIARRMADIPAAEWDCLPGPGDRPLLSWGFLALLEESGSIRPETGWNPVHILVRDRGSGRLAAAAPFYIRQDSWGDFVFDQELARIAREAGLRWYPKLVGMVPATPAPAWRILTAPGQDPAALSSLVLDAAEDLAREAGMGGVHILWPSQDLASLPAGRPGWSAWQHPAFLWTDEGYGDFPGWLASFSKNMRRNILRERSALASAGVVSRIIPAREASAEPGLLAQFADLYESHTARFGPWAAKFMTRSFFLRLPEFLPEGWVLSVGQREGRTVGMAFLLEGPERLYGRYYGAAEEIPNLHFELCYYRPVEYALARGLYSFDPGMGGPHKARRGFRSGLSPSFHRLFDPRLAKFLEQILPGVNQAEAEDEAALNRELPYKAPGSGASALPGR